MQHFKFVKLVNWRIRGFVFWCHEQVTNQPKALIPFISRTIPNLPKSERNQLNSTEIYQNLPKSLTYSLHIGPYQNQSKSLSNHIENILKSTKIYWNQPKSLSTNIVLYQNQPPKSTISSLQTGWKDKKMIQSDQNQT